MMHTVRYHLVGDQRLIVPNDIDLETLESAPPDEAQHAIVLGDYLSFLRERSHSSPRQQLQIRALEFALRELGFTGPDVPSAPAAQPAAIYHARPVGTRGSR